MIDKIEMLSMERKFDSHISNAYGWNHIIYYNGYQSLKRMADKRPYFPTNQ